MTVLQLVTYVVFGSGT